MSGGSPVAGALVEIKDDDLLRPDDLLAQGRTGPDGRFAIHWAAEQGLVETELDVYAEYDGDASYGPSTTPRHKVKVASAPAYPTSLALDALPRRAYVGDAVSFTGRLQYGDQPLEGALVKIKEDDPLKPDQLLGSGRTGPDGRFAVQWTASAGLVETDFDVYADFGGASGYAKSQTARQKMAVLKYGGDIRLDPFPRSVAEGDSVIFSGTLALEGHGTEGAKVYIMDEDALNPDDLLATAYVESDGRFAANWFASRVDADRTADVYAVFEGSNRLYRQTTCDEGPTFDFGGLCTGTVPLDVQAGGRGGDPAGGYRDGGAAYIEMYYSKVMAGRPHVAIAPGPDGPGDARRYIVPVQEGILMWTSAMEGRYGGDWGVEFSVIEPGVLFFDERPDVVVNLVSHEDDAGCLDEYWGWAYIHRNPPKTVQAYVCTTSGGSPVSRSDAAATAAHEFIHAVGLGHAFNKAGDMMCSTEDGRPTCPVLTSKSDVPSGLNVEAVAQMYGTDGFAVPNNPVEYKSRFYEGAPGGNAPATSAGRASAASLPPPAASLPPDPGAAPAVIPAWIKASAGWWADGLVSDEEFVRGIEYMIQNGIVQVRPAVGDADEGGEGAGGAAAIPQWVKAGAKRWADGVVSDEAFARGIGLLVSMGIIRV